MLEKTTEAKARALARSPVFSDAAITGENVQINMSFGNSAIDATQSNNGNLDKLSELVKALEKQISADIGSDELLSLKESVETIQHEMAQEKPKKSLVNTALKALKAIKGTAEFAATIMAIIQFVSSTL